VGQDGSPFHVNVDIPMLPGSTEQLQPATTSGILPPNIFNTAPDEATGSTIARLIPRSYVTSPRCGHKAVVSSCESPGLHMRWQVSLHVAVCSRNRLEADESSAVARAGTRTYWRSELMQVGVRLPGRDVQRTEVPSKKEVNVQDGETRGVSYCCIISIGSRSRVMLGLVWWSG
jgi:hypothetical protein